jgi:hypothetical protein
MDRDFFLNLSVCAIWLIKFDMESPFCGVQFQASGDIISEKLFYFFISGYRRMSELRQKATIILQLIVLILFISGDIF